MDYAQMTLPVLIALVIGKALKTHPEVNNQLIPVFLILQQVLQELVKQMQGGAGVHPEAAIAAAVPVVATAVLTHTAGKGLIGLLKKAAPAALNILKLVVK